MPAATAAGNMATPPPGAASSAGAAAGSAIAAAPPATATTSDSATFPDLNSADQSSTQWLFTEEDLQMTPSVLAGLSMKQERQNRAKGVNFILQVGILLKLPQITLATAAVFLHRFFMRHSMIKDMSATAKGKAGAGGPSGRPQQQQQPDYHHYSVAAASVWLAAKVEENCRKMKEVVVACVRVAQKDSNKVVDEQDKEYWRWRDTIIALEDKLLEGLCFDLSLESPYTALYDIMCRFDAQDHKVFRNAAWAFVNDSCLTPLCVLFPSRTIAAASVYAAARSCKLDFLDEEGRPWWDIIGVQLVDIRRACNYMADVYEDAPLREGGRQDLYQRTPVNGDESHAKTRAIETGSSSSNTGVKNDTGKAGLSGADQTFTRESSVMSTAASDVSTTRKRIRDGHGNEDDGSRSNRGTNGNGKGSGDRATSKETASAGNNRYPVSMNDVPWGGETPGERAAKRVKNVAATNGVPPEGDAPVDQMQLDEQRYRESGGADEEMKNESELVHPDEVMGAVSPDMGGEGSEEGELEEWVHV